MDIDREQLHKQLYDESSGCFVCIQIYFFFSSRRRHTRLQGDWSSDVCSSDLSTPPSLISASRNAIWELPVARMALAAPRWAMHSARNACTSRAASAAKSFCVA